MKIGTIQLESPVILGPMAGVTDLSFRLICRSFYKGLMVTEMVSAKAFTFKDQKTHQMMHIETGEHPVAIQMFGSDPACLSALAAFLNDHPTDLIDINMGCPAPKIVKNGEGSALMQTPKLVEQILNEVVKAAQKPVTVKFRKGWDDQSVNALEIARIAEAAGVSAITVHGRTRDQFYSGKADWDIIRQVKEAVKIPVIGNGDVFSLEDAIAMKERTGVDGIMIARGAQGNPWLLRQVERYWETGEVLPLPTPAEKMATALEHFSLMRQHKGDHIALLEMRKHAAWYLKGIPHTTKIKNAINVEKDPEKLVELLESVGLKST